MIEGIELKHFAFFSTAWSDRSTILAYFSLARYCAASTARSLAVPVKLGARVSSQPRNQRKPVSLVM
jgi:hypothetical protein